MPPVWNTETCSTLDRCANCHRPCSSRAHFVACVSRRAAPLDTAQGAGWRLEGPCARGMAAAAPRMPARSLTAHKDRQKRYDLGSPGDSSGASGLGASQSRAPAGRARPARRHWPRPDRTIRDGLGTQSRVICWPVRLARHVSQPGAALGALAGSLAGSPARPPTARRPKVTPARALARSTTPTSRHGARKGAYSKSSMPWRPSSRGAALSVSWCGCSPRPCLSEPPLPPLPPLRPASLLAKRSCAVVVRVRRRRARGAQGKDTAVLASFNRTQSELSSTLNKIFKVDDHMGIAMSGVTADGRILCRFMRNECINHRRGPYRSRCRPVGSGRLPPVRATAILKSPLHAVPRRSGPRARVDWVVDCWKVDWVVACWKARRLRGVGCRHRHAREHVGT